MIEPPPPSAPSALRRVFYNSFELRAGWRLLIAIAMYAVLMYANHSVSRRLLRHADDVIKFLVFELTGFALILFVSWMMGRIEGRNLGDYGLPGSKAFGKQFWQGARWPRC